MTNLIICKSPEITCEVDNTQLDVKQLTSAAVSRGVDVQIQEKELHLKPV